MRFLVIFLVMYGLSCRAWPKKWPEIISYNPWSCDFWSFLSFCMTKSMTDVKKMSGTMPRMTRVPSHARSCSVMRKLTYSLHKWRYKFCNSIYLNCYF
jgi:hypothetical protein